MSVLQYYYTSFVHPETTYAGFQVKAKSAGISLETESLIARLIAYQIPASLNERDIQSHPIALRYYYHSSQECVFLCSQSSGNDESGRPGNFFAHALVLEPQIFTTIPPIFYWKSDFWHKDDAEERYPSNILPSLSAFEEVPSLDVEQMWSFVTSAAQDDHLRKLMSALIHCHKTLRRIVIVGAADQVALWIAVLSGLLPPPYRPLVSFATYHHDPRQGYFVITGTTKDSYFSNVLDDKFSYFVFDMETNRISEVEASPYADLVASMASAEQYELQALSLFSLVMRRFYHLIDNVVEEKLTEYFEWLDLFALYYTLVEQPSAHCLSETELRAVDFALAGFERLYSLDEDDIADLIALDHALELAQKAGSNSRQFEQLYNRLKNLLKA